MGFTDIAFLPWAARLYILEHYRDFKLPEQKPFDRYRKWFSACEQKKAFTETMPALDRLLQEYQRYANASTNSKVCVAVKENKVLP
jgi:glutathione S-transferase